MGEGVEQWMSAHGKKLCFISSFKTLCTEIYFRSEREKEEWSPFLQFHTDPDRDCLFSAAREDRVKIS